MEVGAELIQNLFEQNKNQDWSKIKIAPDTEVVANDNVVDESLLDDCKTYFVVHTAEGPNCMQESSFVLTFF